MVDKLSLVLFEKQTEIDVPSAVLSPSDFMDVFEAARHDGTPEREEDKRGSGQFDQYARTVGKTDTEVTLVHPLYSRGTSGDPDFVRGLECAGFQRTLDDLFIKMIPRSDIRDAGTLWGYLGGPGTNKAILEKYGNIMFDWSIAGQAGKKVMLTLNGKGKLVALPVLATQPSSNPYREREVPPAIINGTIILNGKTYKVQKFEITGGQDVVNNDDGTDAYCGGDTEITDRSIEWTATVYMKPDTNLIPHTNIYANTSGIWDIRWGSKYHTYDLRLYSRFCNILDAKRSNVNGVLAWDLKGIFEENELELWIYNGTTSSYSSQSTSASSDSNSSSSSSGSSDSASSSSTST
jgi:hypothetical protein